MSRPKVARYILHPGYTRSIQDGDTHYVGAGRLRDLYRVPPDAQVVTIDGQHRRRFYGVEGDIHCWPREDGKYPAFEDRADAHG